MLSELTEWFCLGAGVLCLIEGVVLAGRRGRARDRWSKQQPPVLICLAVMLAPANAARLLDWTGTGKSVVTVVSLVAGVTVIVLVVRSRALAGRAARPPRDRSHSEHYSAYHSRDS